MGLETGTWVDDLVTSNPDGTADPKSQGDDHLRLIKSVLKSTFPNATREFRFETVLTKTAAYTITASDQRALVLADASGGAFTITLPLGSNVFAGFSVIVEKSDSSANAVTVDGNGAETVDGAATRVLDTQFEAVKFMWDGSEWKSLAATIVGTAGIKNGAVTTAKVASSAITYAKMQDVSATERLLGRHSAGAGSPEEIALGAGLSLSAGTLSASGGDTLGTDRTLPAAENDSFTGLPAGLNEIVIMLRQVSLNGTDEMFIRIGDSGGISSADYIGSVGEVATTNFQFSTAGYLININSAAADDLSGNITLSRKTGNEWLASFVLFTSGRVFAGGGLKVLTGEVTQVQITSSGSNTFDGGSWNIRHH